MQSRVQVAAAHHTALNAFLNALASGKGVYASQKGGGFIEYMDLEAEKATKKGYAPTSRESWCAFFSGYAPYLIQHDWSLFAEAISVTPTDEWKLPFDECAFEVRARSQGAFASVIAFVNQLEDGYVNLRLMVRALDRENMWLVTHTSGGPSLATMYSTARRIAGETAVSASEPSNAEIIYKILAIIRGASVAIDMDSAEVKTHEPSAKLNAARARNGKRPMVSYRVIDLAARHRTAAAKGEPTGRHVKLHRRSGHWWPRLSNTESKFEGFRHWRKWRFVGDPNLGFVDQFRLL